MKTRFVQHYAAPVHYRAPILRRVSVKISGLIFVIQYCAFTSLTQESQYRFNIIRQMSRGYSHCVTAEMRANFNEQKLDYNAQKEKTLMKGKEKERRQLYFTNGYLSKLSTSYQDPVECRSRWKSHMKPTENEHEGKHRVNWRPASSKTGTEVQV